ncbi:MAG: class I SAM-dependent DNA methyltransferase [Gemmatimonadaceae bacterium]
MDPGYGAQYARLYRTHWWWRAREEYLVRLLERTLGAGPAGAVLDFGCGDGLLFPALSRFGVPYGIEPDASLLDPAGPWRSSISTEPLRHDEGETGRYRLIVALDVLEHIAEPAPIVRELARRLRPGGWFVATVPAFQSLWTAHDDLNHHVRRYRLVELEALARDAGLEVVESRYLFSWVAIAKWIVGRIERVVRRAPASPTVPAAPVNAALLALSRLEHALLAGTRPPFGSSAMVVARRAS